MLVTSLNVVKNFVLVGDASFGVQFLQYVDDGKRLTLLSKDFHRTDVYATEFVIAGPSLHMLAADGAGALRLYSYAPRDKGSWKGQTTLTQVNPVHQYQQPLQQ